MSHTVPVEIAVEVRWRDLDGLGHVNNAVFFTYFEIARMRYLRAMLGEDWTPGPTKVLPAGYEFILAEISCQFRSPVTIKDHPLVAISVSWLGHSSFGFDYRMIDSVTGRLLAEGSSTQVWYDYSLGAAVPIPEDAIVRIELMQGERLRRREGNGNSRLSDGARADERTGSSIE